jgi:hypothetical protein
MQYTYFEVAERYGLVTPTQIKQRIIWNNLKALIAHHYGNDPQNDLIMQRYECDWRAAEAEELKQLRT